MIETKYSGGKSRAEQRLQELIDIANRSRIDPPKFAREKFLWVFGNLIQEYFADRVYNEVKKAKELQKTVRNGLEIARDWFGEDHLHDWPFHRDWLKDYITGRFVGSRRGKSAESKRHGGIDEFIERYPRSTAICQWYLGCIEKNDLQVDHKLAWKKYGASTPENFQWLCRKHNNDWKKTLLFWGDNFIPFRDYKKSDQPR